MRLSWDPMAARDVRLESAAVWFQASTAWARPTSAAWSASIGSTVRVAGPGPGPASSAAAKTRGRSPPWPGSGPPTGADLPRCARSGRHSPDESGGRDRPVGCVGSGGSRQAVRGRHPAYCDWRRRRSVGRGRAAAPAAGTAVARWGPGSPRLGESGAVLHLVRGAVESMAHHQGAVEPGGQTDVVHAADDGVCGCS